jgi:hypothetical protein
VEHQIMKITQQMTFGAVLTLVLAANAPAQNGTTPQKNAYGYDYYAYSSQQEPAVAPTPPTAASQAPEAAATPYNSRCENACGDCGEQPCRWCRDGALADPWTLPQPAFLKDRNIKVGGWLEGGVYGNQYGAPYNGPIGMRGVGDGFTADQLWIYGERETDTKGCGWDVGGRVDYLFGADGPDTQCFGDRTFDYGWNTARDYGSAMPQLYAELAYNDIKVKLGHFFTPIGYEVVPATGNFFYSHSYSHTYGEPFTHTGALAEYSYNENVKAYGGWVNGWDEGFEGKDGGSMFLGGLALTLSEKATLAWFCNAGKLGNGQAFAGAASGNAYMNSIVFTYKLNDKWTYVLEHDLGTNDDVVGPGVDNQWYEVNNYIFYKVNDCLSYGGRFEWFQDPQGVKVVQGDRGNYYAVTGGFNYRPHANVNIRPELRYDKFDGTAPNGGLPFDGGQASSQLSFGTDFIFTY